MAAEVVQRVRSFLRRPVVRGVITGVILALSFGYLGTVLVRNWDQLLAYEWQLDYGQALLAFVYYSIALMLAIGGWSLIMRRMTPVTDLGKHIKYYIYTNLMRRLPAPLLDFFGRAYLYQREGIAGSLTVTISFLEWLLILLSGLLVYLVTLPFLPLPAPWRSPWIPLLALIIGMVLVQPRVIHSVLRLLGKGELPVSFGYGDLLIWLGIYAAVWVMGGLVLYAGINSLYDLSLSDLPAVIGIWALSGLIPTLILLTPAGFGLKELTLGVLLAYLMPAPLAVVLALLMRVGLTLFEILWGLFALVLRPS